MAEENINQEFKLKNVKEAKNYLITEIDQNQLMSKERKKACEFLNYIEHFLILVSAGPGCIAISDFAS